MRAAFKLLVIVLVACMVQGALSCDHDKCK